MSRHVQMAAHAKTGPRLLCPFWSAAYWAMTELPARVEAALPAPATSPVPGMAVPAHEPRPAACAVAFASNGSQPFVDAFQQPMTGEANLGSFMACSATI